MALNHPCLQGDFRPSVDILLPVCGEPLAVLNNTWRHVAALRYGGPLQVWVLDDALSDDTRTLAQTYGFNYIRRDDRPHLKKAGNLRNAFKITKARRCTALRRAASAQQHGRPPITWQLFLSVASEPAALAPQRAALARCPPLRLLSLHPSPRCACCPQGDIFTIFDADFCPRPDFLQEVVPYFSDPGELLPGGRAPASHMAALGMAVRVCVPASGSSEALAALGSARAAPHPLCRHRHHPDAAVLPGAPRADVGGAGRQRGAGTEGGREKPELHIELRAASCSSLGSLQQQQQLLQADALT